MIEKLRCSICLLFVYFSDSSFRTLPTDEEQTNYSLEVDRTLRRHRSFIDKENRTQSKKATTSNPKMVKPHTKTKPLQSTNKPNTNANASTSRGHVRVAYDDSDSSSHISQNFSQVETRSPARSSHQNQPQRRGKTLPASTIQTRHRRKLKVPQKKTGALNEIRKLQHSTVNLIPLLTFGRLVREIMIHRSPIEMRITPLALQALRDSTESYMVGLFEDVNRIALNRNQVTIQVKDMQLAMYIRGHK